jgi:hypothetical protein
MMGYKLLTRWKQELEDSDLASGESSKCMPRTRRIRADPVMRGVVTMGSSACTADAPDLCTA